MAFNGTGTFVRLYNWQQDAANSINIRADRMDAEMDGMATGLSDCVTRDGQSPFLANLPAAGFKLTGLGAGSVAGDSLAWDQIFSGAVSFIATSYTFTNSPIIPTPSLGDSSTKAASTAFAMTMQSPAFSGTPTAPTAAGGTSTTQIATTAFAMTMQSPGFTGSPTAPTQAAGDNSTKIATTAFAMNMQSPAFVGTPTAPTAVLGTNTTQIATTFFVNQTAFNTALPAQPGGSAPFVPVSVGGTVTWQPFTNDTANYLAGVI